MKVTGFDNREYTWPPTGRHVYDNDIRPRSGYHLRVRELLKLMYPGDSPMEEVLLPGTDKLRADFYLHWRRMVIEVHGEQHYEFIPFFHVDKMGFFKARERDLKKIEWCHMNNIRVVELSYKDDDATWRKQIERGNQESSSAEA